MNDRAVAAGEGGSELFAVKQVCNSLADYIVDLGPEGGSGGGQIVACGTPEQIAACPESFTGQYLKKLLK